MLAGHPDLELQIEEITQQILQTPASADLYLKRGDLLRRHREWARSQQDFEHVRVLEPDQPQLDWYEGRLAVDAGRWVEGDQLLSRFLERNPKHSSAYHNRAWARWQLGKPKAAAQDYASAITFSERPGPTLYRSLVIAQFASGESLRVQAKITVDTGLRRFPGEASLLGLGVDLALVDAEVERAASYLNTISPGLSKLPQWTFRQAVLACIQGQDESSMVGFVSLLPGAGNQAGNRPGSWTVAPELIEQLIADVEPQKCRETVLIILGAQEP